MSSPAKPAASRKRMIIAVVVFVVVASVGGYYLYQNSLQPNIQVTAVEITRVQKQPVWQVVVNASRVAKSAPFSYTASQIGFYHLTFVNTNERFIPKSVTLTYSAAGKSDTQSFEVRHAGVEIITVKLAAGQTVSGGFTVSGGGDDLVFRVDAQTGPQVVSFSFTSVNSGTANDFAVISLQADDKEVWSNLYFIQVGQRIRLSSTASVPDLEDHKFSIVVREQKKA